MIDFYRSCADVDLSAIRDNVRALMGATTPGTKCMAVIKANAYGHGDVAVAKALEDEADHFAVATLPEAVNLRKNGVTKKILILGYVFPEEYGLLVENDIDATVFDLETAKYLSDEGLRQGKKAFCHIKVDTGMRRIGIEPVRENTELVKKISGLEGLEVRGIFTHFAKADEKDKTHALGQFRDFCRIIDACREAGVEFEYRHCDNSAATIDLKETNLDMVRLGISMYGMYPSDEVEKERVKLTQAIKWTAKVVMVKEVEPGEGVSYGATYVTERKSLIATVSVGYGDGYPRRLFNKGEVLIHGKRAPIIGRVCMDQFMIDVTGIDGVKRGDDVTLTGIDGDGFIPVEELCRIAEGAFHYEFVCDIGKRIPRRYFLDGKCVGAHDYFYDKWDLDI